MKRDLTLREVYQQKQSRTQISLGLIFTVVVLTLVVVFFVYPTISSKKEVAVLGKGEISDKEIQPEENSLENESDSYNTPETNFEEKEQEEIVKLDEKTIRKDPITVGNEEITKENIEVDKPDYCSDSQILTYKQIISSSNSVIESAKAYINNPTCDYPYTPSTCNLAYDNCVSSVENWYEADGTCSRLPRSGICAALNQERYYRLQQCEENKISCNNTCETYKEQEVLQKLSDITYREGLIIENEQKLSNCNAL